MPRKNGVFQVRTYGKHKLRTVKTSAWESPEEVFNSPLAKKDRVAKPPVTTFPRSNTWSKPMFAKINYPEKDEDRITPLGTRQQGYSPSILISSSSSETSSPQCDTKSKSAQTRRDIGELSNSSPILLNVSVESRRQDVAFGSDFSPVLFDSPSEQFRGAVSCMKNSGILQHAHSTPNNTTFDEHLIHDKSSCTVSLKKCSVLLERLSITPPLTTDRNTSEPLPCNRHSSSNHISKMLNHTKSAEVDLTGHGDKTEKCVRNSYLSSNSCNTNREIHSGQMSVSLSLKECTVSLEKLKLTPLLPKSRKRSSEKSSLSQTDDRAPPSTPVKNLLLPATVLSFKDALTPIKIPVKQNEKPACLSTVEKVLLECQQDKVIKMKDVFKPSVLKGCMKIGEGVYGEVYSSLNTKKKKVAIKIIPIGGDFIVNRVPQKTFEEILPEIVISRELSNLGHSEEAGKENKDVCNLAPNFINVHNVSCCQGKYPVKLVKEWDTWDKKNQSENDRPDIFPEDQHFIVFEFANGGRDLEHFDLQSAEEALSILQQTAFSLAVAEQAFEFEHRDLHWGNVLISPTEQETVAYCVNGEEFVVKTHGVFASVIDFTLSRLRKDGLTVFCDLASDEDQFTGKGDYQFDVYRLMRKANDNEWDSFNPFTNVLWLHYLADKMLKSKTYPTKDRKQTTALRKFLRQAQTYESCADMVREGCFEPL